MQRKFYKMLWANWLYEQQPTYPGGPMMLEEAQKTLEEAEARPRGITAQELMDLWNIEHARALLWAQEDRERRERRGKK